MLTYFNDVCHTYADVILFIKSKINSSVRSVLWTTATKQINIL